MMRPGVRSSVGAAAAIALLGAAALFVAERRPRPIAVDYPVEGSVFPPEFPPPRLEWRDASPRARAWTIDVRFGEDAAPSLRATSRGEPIEIGEIDPRAVGATNEPPRLTPEQAAAHTWRPDPAAWEAIKKGSTERDAVLTITGFADEGRRRVVSRGRVAIRTSTDPVGAPVFYRDVPLMPSEGEKGVIKPLDQKLVPLIAWRLRNVAETESRVLMTGIHSCANCHSFSQDGKSMGMDLDGPNNNKGLYALVPIRPQAEIRRENVIEWSTFRGKLGGKLRVAFMSRVSPDGRYVVTTINDPGRGQTDYARRQAPQDLRQNYYVANFKDYRFLQVFYPTRGDPRLVQQGDRPAPAVARGRRPPLRAHERRLEPRRELPRVRAGRGPGRLPRGLQAGRARQRPERDAGAVRPLPHPVQRRPGRRGGADRRRLGQRHEQQLPEDLAGREVDRLRAGPERPAHASRRAALHRPRRRAARHGGCARTRRS